MDSVSVAAPAPRVSVIMNCYNGERYLAEALDSVFAQTLGDFEIIFWDNVSTDRSAEIAQARGPRVRYFLAPEQTPLGEARKLAAAQARGTFLAFLDTDDRYEPHALARLAAAFESGPWALVYGAIRFIDDSGHPLQTLRTSPLAGGGLDALLRQFDIYLPAVLVRRAALIEEGLTFDPSITASEEYCLFMQLAARRPIKVISDVLGEYRVHGGALTNRSISKWADEREYTLGRIVAHDPAVEQRHRGAMREARARARYYRARWLISENRKTDAIRQLASALRAGPMYWALLVLSLLPRGAWNAVHAWRTHRVLRG